MGVQNYVLHYVCICFVLRVCVFLADVFFCVPCLHFVYLRFFLCSGFACLWSLRFFLCSVFAFFWRLRVVGVLGLYVLAVQLQCLHSATNLHCSR